MYPFHYTSTSLYLFIYLYLTHIYMGRCLARVRDRQERYVHARHSTISAQENMLQRAGRRQASGAAGTETETVGDHARELHAKMT